MSVSARDHSLSLNPFLQTIVPSRHNGPVYWLGRCLRWHDTSGRAWEAELDPARVERWCSRRSAGALWTDWSTRLARSRFLVEHTSVNPVHPLHAGSLRSTLIGNALAGLLRSAGADVEVRYFVNDLGRQVRLAGWIATRADWAHVPDAVRTDEAVGTLYALAAMIHGRRYGDVARLAARHPWLTCAVDVPALAREAQHTGLPRDQRSLPGLVDEMCELAASDLRLVGAHIDAYDYESALPNELHMQALELAREQPVAQVNGVTCLRRPEGLVPLLRRDGSTLYFLRDLVNTRRRAATGRTLLHVIGDDQQLPQRALHEVLPESAIEQVMFAGVTDHGKRFSARQNRLLTVNGIHRSEGSAGLWVLALPMVMRRRTRRVDVTNMNGQTLLTSIRSARRAALTGQGISNRADLSNTAAWRLASAMLASPGVLDRGLRGRAVHHTARLLCELSTRYLRAARHHALTPWLRDWFLEMQPRLAAMHGMGIDAMAEQHSERQQTGAQMTRRSA